MLYICICIYIYIHTYIHTYISAEMYRSCVGVAARCVRARSGICRCTDTPRSFPPPSYTCVSEGGLTAEPEDFFIFFSLFFRRCKQARSLHQLRVLAKEFFFSFRLCTQAGNTRSVSGGSGVGGVCGRRRAAPAVRGGAGARWRAFCGAIPGKRGARVAGLSAAGCGAAG
jgi:hypothetical protein